MKKRYLYLLFCLLEFTIQAQQNTFYNHYFLNKYLISPVYAGNSGYTDLMLLYRKQWVGLPDAPESFGFTMDWPIKNDKAGLGLTLNNDRSNIITRTSMYGSFAYKVNISLYSRLYFGISVGFVNTGIDFSRVRAKDPFESTLLQYPAQRLLFDGSAGIAYQYRSFRIGLSSMQLFQSAANYTDVFDNKALSYKLVRHYNLMLEYAYDVNEKFRIAPLVLLRSTQGSGINIDFNTTVFYQKKYWLNVNYRFKDALAFTLGFVIDKRYAVGYTFEMPAFNMYGKNTGATHELMLKIRFVKPNDKAKTGYEFIDNSIKRTTSDKLMKEEDKQVKPLPKKENK
ncbi:MAG: type IX secretion system membrane protein PorP/SprF [Bacteroidetes bacterium]|nr:MAG: type IX secretion system membrane protein PorP/SprF [Bacteroidota bacterium]